MAAEQTTTLTFLSGGGEMGELIRQYDWATTPIGTPDQWPQSLCTTLSIVLHAQHPMFLWWGPDLIQFYNDAYRPVLSGVKQDSVALGQRGEDAWPGWPAIKPLIDQVLIGGEAIWGEDLLLPLNRYDRLENVYWRFSYSPVWGEAGQVVGVLVVGQEATRQILSLQEDHDRYQFALESAQFGLWETDMETNVVHWDARCNALFGGDLIANALPWNEAMKVIHPDDVAQVMERAQWALDPRSGGHYDATYRVISPHNGRLYWSRYMGQAYFNTEGKPYRFIGAAQNVTKEIEIQRQIEASAAYLQSVFRHAWVAIAIFYGTDLVIELANPSTCIIWGHSESDVLGKPMAEALPELAGQGFDVLLADVMRTGQPFVSKELPATLVHNGQRVTSYFDIAFEPLPDPDGRVNRVLVTSVDVTERMQTRQHIEQLLVRERELNELKSNFVTLASHEFRTPMAMILSSAALIGRYNGADDAGDRDRHVQSIKSEVQGLTSLLENFLSLSRMEQQALYSRPYSLDIREFCQNLIRDMQGIIKPGQRMVYQHDTDEQAMLIDGQLLKTILINLLINASKYSDDEKKIELTTSLQDNQLLVSVKDEGIGIPAQDQGKLFTNFFRAQNVAHVEGTGLGLYIVRRYVDLMGGTISFTSQLGSGTVFTVQLPSCSLPQPPSA